MIRHLGDNQTPQGSSLSTCHVQVPTSAFRGTRTRSKGSGADPTLPSIRSDPHFTDKEARVQREVTCQGPIQHTQQSQA